MSKSVRVPTLQCTENPKINRFVYKKVLPPVVFFLLMSNINQKEPEGVQASSQIQTHSTFQKVKMISLTYIEGPGSPWRPVDDQID
jgi:hypothetical protein